MVELSATTGPRFRPKLMLVFGLEQEVAAHARREWAMPCTQIAWSKTNMHETHRIAAEQHELAAQAHRTAAEHNEKRDEDAAIWHSERALRYSERAYQLAREAHNKSGQIVAVSA